jgi:hypothetical protein
MAGLGPDVTCEREQGTHELPLPAGYARGYCRPMTGNAPHDGKAKSPVFRPGFLFDALVGRTGFEPVTNGLKVRCSTS